MGRISTCKSITDRFAVNLNMNESVDALSVQFSLSAVKSFKHLDFLGVLGQNSFHEIRYLANQESLGSARTEPESAGNA